MRRRETRTAWGAEATHGSLVHGVRLALGVVRISDTVNDQLRLLARDLFVVGLNIAQVIATGIVSLAHAHGVVGEVDIAVVAEEFWHLERSHLRGNEV